MINRFDEDEDQVTVLTPKFEDPSSPNIGSVRVSMNSKADKRKIKGIKRDEGFKQEDEMSDI